MPIFVAQDFRLASGAVLRQIEIFFYGSTCAGSSNPATGQPRSESFPAVTMEDVVRAQGLLLDPLGTTRLHAVAGCSLGGFRAYQWAVTLPWVIATDTADHDSIDLGTAIPGLLQRFRDEPGWNDGKPAPAAMAEVRYLEIQSALGPSRNDRGAVEMGGHRETFPRHAPIATPCRFLTPKVGWTCPYSRPSGR